MSQFNDLLADKGQGTACDRLTPISPTALARLHQQHPDAPEGYIDFLTHIGYGEIGQANFMLYEGLITADEVFGSMPPGLEQLLLFGDDFGGYHCGFDTANDWHIVEVDPTSHETNLESKDFAAFIRLKIAAAT